jgi:hypothetical protein
MPSRRYARPFAALIVALALGVPLAACGDDEDDNGNGEQVAGADLERYCELSNDLDQAGTEQFSQLENDPNATDADFEALERQFIAEHEAEIDELPEVAPDEIAADVEILIAQLRGRAEPGEGPAEGDTDEAEAAAAEERVNRFEEENCPA